MEKKILIEIVSETLPTLVKDKVHDKKLDTKPSKDPEDINKTVNHLNLIDMCRVLLSTMAERTFFSRAHGTFTRIDHTQGQKKVSLN